MFRTAKLLARIARDRLGLEIRRAPRAKAKRIRPVQDGRIVEFTGMPGVGKSHLMRRCLEALGPSYMTQDEIRMAGNAADYRHIADPDIRSLYSALIGHLLSQAREHHDEGVDLHRQLHYLGHFSSKLKSNMHIDSAFPIQALTDEGLVESFSHVLLERAQSGDPGAQTVLRRRHIILMEADPELTLSQIRERERDLDRPFTRYLGWSDAEILRYYAENTPGYRASIEGLRPWAAGVLRLSRSDSTQHNVEAVAAFVRGAPSPPGAG